MFKNQNGHFTVEVTGRALRGAQEVDLSASRDLVRMDEQAIWMFDGDGSYDANHRLQEGKVYKVAIILESEVKSSRTTPSLQDYAKQFGYQKPLAGLMPRLREAITDKEMEEMGISYIIGLHDPIEDAHGEPCILGLYREDGGQWLCSYQDRPDEDWYGLGALAFEIPE